MAIKPKSYETLYLVRPDISGEDLTSIQDKLTKSIASSEGEIQKNEKWADRDLAYPINDYTKGSYYILVYKALPKVVADLEKHLSFHKTDILRFMTVLYDENETPVKEATAKSSPSPEPAKTTTTATKATTATSDTPPTADETTATADPDTPPAAAETTKEDTSAAEDTPPKADDTTAADTSNTGFTSSETASDEPKEQTDETEGDKE